MLTFKPEYTTPSDKRAAILTNNLLNRPYKMEKIKEKDLIFLILDNLIKSNFEIFGSNNFLRFRAYICGNNILNL